MGQPAALAWVRARCIPAIPPVRAIAMSAPNAAKSDSKTREGGGDEDLRALADSAVEELSATLRKRGMRMEPMAQRSVSGFLAARKSRGGNEHASEFYGNLIRCAIDAGHLPTARRLFGALQSPAAKADGLAPEAAAYSSMILGYCKQRVPERALGLVEAAREADIELEDKTWVYSQIIYTLGRSRQVSEAAKFFQHVEEEAYAPAPVPRVLYRRMIEACSHGGEFDLR